MSERTGPSLQGIRVAVPAARRAAETEALIRRWGGTPLVGPVMEEVDTDDEAGLHGATLAAIEARVAWSVHLTGTGTRRWFERAAGWGLLDGLLEALSSAGVVARGPKSATALRRHGIEPDWIPQRETSAEIRDWLVPKLTRTDAACVQLYGDRRPPLVAAIASAAGAVIEVAPYRWTIPAEHGRGDELVRALASGGAEAIVITSAPQAENLFALARRIGLEQELARALRERVFVAAVGQVARDGLRRQGVEADLVPESPRLGALARALASARDRIAAKTS